MRWLLLFVLLAGCSASGPVAPADDMAASMDAADLPSKVQEATVEWMVPVTPRCTAHPLPDPTDGILYGRLDLAEHTRGKRFTAKFTSGDANVGFDVEFYDADDQYIDGVVELTMAGSDGHLVGVVPEQAAYATFNTCGGGTSVVFRAGDIPAS